MPLKEIDISGEVLDIIVENFQGLFSGGLRLSYIQGGQSAANIALAELDITRSADQRSEVLPFESRGATVYSPYIRHNLLTLEQVFRAVIGTSYKDCEKFRDELFWQAYARHFYARVGAQLF